VSKPKCGSLYLDKTGVNNTEDYSYGYCHRSERFHILKLGHRTERLLISKTLMGGDFIPHSKRYKNISFQG
jgi:hypothetical protein